MARETSTERTSKRTETPSAGKRTEAAGKRTLKLPFTAHRGVLIALAVVVVLVMASAIMYKPLKILYREARQERVLKEQLAAIKEYNEDLKVKIQSLETTEGVQDYASEELGLVLQGEHAVVVLQGGNPLSKAQNTRQQQIQDLEKTSQPFGSWTSFLDRLFAYDE